MSAKAPSVNFTVISQVDDGVPSMHDGLAIMNINNMEELRLFEGDTVLLSCEGAESLVCLVGKQQCRTGCICLCEKTQAKLGIEAGHGVSVSPCYDAVYARSLTLRRCCSETSVVEYSSHVLKILYERFKEFAAELTGPLHTGDVLEVPETEQQPAMTLTVESIAPRNHGFVVPRNASAPVQTRVHISLDKPVRINPASQVLVNLGFAGKVLGPVMNQLRMPTAEWKGRIAAGDGRTHVLAGLAGSGKRTLLRAAAKYSRAAFIELSLLAGGEGAIRASIPAVFARAVEISPTLLYVSNIDVLSEGDEASSLRTALFWAIQELPSSSRVVVVGGTTRPSLVEGSWGPVSNPCRPRLDLLLPSQGMRTSLFRKHLAGTKLSLPLDTVASELAAQTDGFMASEVLELCKHTISTARQVQLYSGLAVDRFRKSLETFQRGSLLRLPRCFSNILGRATLKSELLSTMTASGCVRGLVLYGPAKCGKRLLSEALAGQLCMRFIPVDLSQTSVSISALVDMALLARPCLLALAGLEDFLLERSGVQSEGKSSSRKMALQDLTVAIKRLRAADEVLVVGTTVDSIVLRCPGLIQPSCFAKAVFVGPPDSASRVEMLTCLLSAATSDAVDISISEAAARTENFTFEELREVCEQVATSGSQVATASKGSARSMCSEPGPGLCLSAAIDGVEPRISDWDLEAFLDYGNESTR